MQPSFRNRPAALLTKPKDVDLSLRPKRQPPERDAKRFAGIKLENVTHLEGYTKSSALAERNAESLPLCHASFRAVDRRATVSLKKCICLQEQGTGVGVGWVWVWVCVCVCVFVPARARACKPARLLASLTSCLHA